MATGTGNLPFPGKVYNPFDILTAEELNEDVSNIESLATGVGVGDGAIGPLQRSGGFAAGVITGATLGTTGNKNITGVGFQPKMVRFVVLPPASGATSTTGTGVMTATSQFYTATSSTTTASARNSSTSAAIGWVPGGSSTPSLLASRVSLNSDGFTINVTTANSAIDVGYEAFG